MCQRAKPERTLYPGKLQPLPVPRAAWEVITMDFIEGLPSSYQYNCILVIVDKFSKYSHFIPIRHPYTAKRIAEIFLDQFYRLHSMPLAIVSDRDLVFTSAFWQEFFRSLGTDFKLSIAYRPQTDGQIERVNQSVECYLC